MIRSKIPLVLGIGGCDWVLLTALSAAAQARSLSEWTAALFNGKGKKSK